MYVYDEIGSGFGKKHFNEKIYLYLRTLYPWESLGVNF